MAQRVMWVVVALLVPPTAGCATWVAQGGLKEPYAPYDGVRVDIAAIQSGVEIAAGANNENAEKRRLALALAICAMFDLPFSAVADPFLLPGTLSNPKRQ